MYAIVISDAWPQYYASSPFKNFLDIHPTESHKDFEILPVNGSLLGNPDFISKLSSFEAVVVDDVYATHIAGILGLSSRHIPLLMIDGDPHRHRSIQIRELEQKYNSVDYVLTGADVDLELPQYFYPPKELRKKKSLYYPHSAPGVQPLQMSWAIRRDYALLSGSMGVEVYPFRNDVYNSRNNFVVSLPFQKLNHQQYFDYMTNYKAAITCTSIFRYTVAKYFEIPWCGCLLVAPRPPDAVLLGMNENNSYFAEIVPDVNYVLRNIDDYSYTAYEGHRLIMERHTIIHRLEYLSRLIKKIRAGGFKAGDELDIFKTAHIKEA